MPVLFSQVLILTTQGRGDYHILMILGLYLDTLIPIIVIGQTISNMLSILIELTLLKELQPFVANPNDPRSVS